MVFTHPSASMHSHISTSREPSNPTPHPQDEPSTPYLIHLRGNDSRPSSPPRTPRTTRVPRNAPSPRAMPHHLEGPGRSPSHSVDTSHPLEKNTSSTRGAYHSQNRDPCQHHIRPFPPPTSTQHPPPRECAGARDMRARQTRAHGPGRHLRAPITPTSTTRTHGALCSTAPRTTIEHVLEGPRGIQGPPHPLAPPITPASPSTQERHTTNP